MKRWLLPLFWMLLTGALWAAPGLEIETRIEQASNPLPFGKPATLVLNLSWDEKWPFQAPPPEKLDLPGFTVIDSFVTDAPPLVSGRQGVTYNLVFTRFEPGPVDIPSVEFETPSGPAKSKALKMVYAGAQPMKGDKPDQLRGPKDAAELSTRDFWIWLAKVVGATLLALLILTAIISKLGVLERWLSPKSRALRQLKKLAKRLDKGTIESPQALLDIVEVTRLYLRRAYGLVTREATSREISEQLTMNNRCANIKPVAKAVLERGDVAKFAGRQSSAEEALDLLEQLRSALQAEKRKP